MFKLEELKKIATHPIGFEEGKWLYTTTMQMNNEPAMTPEQKKQMEDARKQMEAMKSQLPPGFKMPAMPGMNSNGSMTVKFKKCITQSDMAPPQKKDAGNEWEYKQEKETERE